MDIDLGLQPSRCQDYICEQIQEEQEVGVASMETVDKDHQGYAEQSSS